IRLHNELDAVEKKRSRLEQENEELRVKLQDLEVAKQVLQAEMEKARENSLKKRGARPNNKPDKKALPQDSSDLKCQLHFAKEESALMCKKLTKMVKDNEAMREELAKYRSLYGDVDASLTVEEVADSPHTREAEVKVHLKLVEEEANLLSRRIVELEVENRGLRAEMDDMKIQDSPGGVGSQLLLSTSENVMELQRHLQFVEEEADLLRRSLIEMEEQNKLLMNELNHYKSELPAVTEIHHKELLAARLQIAELNGKVKKLQYENRVLLSNLQRCDLASNQGSTRPVLETDAEAGDSAECVPSQVHREDLLAIRDQAQLVTSAIQLLTSPDPSCISPDAVYHKITTNESAEPVLLEKSQTQSSTLPLVEALHGRLQSLQAQLQALSERVDALGQPPERERVEGMCLMPLLSEAEDPAANCSCPADAQFNQNTTQQKVYTQSLKQVGELQQKLWSQERNLRVQESQQLKESLLLISLKLRWLLKQWRLGKKLDTESKDILEVNSVKDFRILLEEDGLSHYGDNKMSAAEEQPLNPTPKDTLSDLKVALQDLSAELREERQSSQELTQQFARAKASWEVERMELKSIITQLEGKMGKASVAGGEKDSLDLKGALKKEREEHQHLLADSYAAVMDLTKQLQISEKNWSRERLELLEQFNQERSQWEQHLREAQSKGTQVRCHMGVKGFAHSNLILLLFICFCGTLSSFKGHKNTKKWTKSISALSEFKSLLDTSLFLPGHKVSGKNWKYLTNDSAMLEKGDQFKTWDCPSTNSNSSFPGLELSKEYIQRSYTAPDKTGIRIYYSPPTVRRMERRPVNEKAQQDPQQGPSSRDAAMIDPSGQTAASAPLSTTSSSTYEQWLSSLSQQHRELLEGRTGGSAPFHGLEILGNLSDDMKEMTNCVRQAIRSSSLERKCSKDTGSQTVGVSSTGTQTAQFVSIGLQTDGPIPTTRGLQGKAWSPRPSTSLSSARSRQISSSLEKVHSRIDRPCCSPKYGSPKLTRRVSTSSSKLETSSTSSRDRSVWNLHNRSGSQNGSAWARSTTTRDSPVLSGLNDGLTSLFSVVEHSGSVESLWKADPSQKYGMVQEFLRNVCGRTVPAGTMDEPKPECLPGVLIGTDNITKIVNKRFMKTQRDEFVATGKDAIRLGNFRCDSVCDCSSQTATSCFARHSRSTTRHTHGQCKHRVQESPMGTEERFDTSNE
uniref:Suppressor of glucose, autophagy associated 1 n=1 Tax=Sinocyclocheilus anshuiensis TaxID=1608454 RepID=A0A671KJZ4_9TELE